LERRLSVESKVYVTSGDSFGQGFGGGSVCGGGRSQPRIGWPEIGPSQVTRSIIWTDSATYLSELSQFIADEQILFSEKGQRLVSAGLITEAEVSASRPTLELTITDTRQTKLPELPGLPGAIDGVILHK
jgi:hypothetical protein